MGLSIPSPSFTKPNGLTRTAPIPASPSDPSPTSPSTEVSWQTCFWILATLALNNMAQPCGKALDFSAHNSVYLRSSPFMALADTFSIPIRIIYTSLSLGVSLRKSLWLFFNWRFEDYESAEAEDGALANIAKSTWLRWILLVLGPLPQALRLASFGGVILTKILGFSFLLSWFSVEALLYFGARYQQRMGTLRASVQVEVSAEQLREYEWRTLGDLEDFFVRVTALAALCSPSFVLYHLIVRAEKLEQTNGDQPASYRGGLMVLALYLGIIVFGLVCWYAFLGLTEFFDKFPRLARYLSVTTKSKGFPEYVGEDGVFCFLFFFLNLGTAILCYGCWYDPSGTNNPGWSAVLG